METSILIYENEIESFKQACESLIIPIIKIENYTGDLMKAEIKVISPSELFFLGKSQQILKQLQNEKND